MTAPTPGCWYYPSEPGTSCAFCGDAIRTDLAPHDASGIAYCGPRCMIARGHSLALRAVERFAMLQAPDRRDRRRLGVRLADSWDEADFRVRIFAGHRPLYRRWIPNAPEGAVVALKRRDRFDVYNVGPDTDRVRIVYAFSVHVLEALQQAREGKR